MSSSWRKLENENGFPYYVNESKNIKQWDHPKFIDIIRRLDDCNYIKYSAYRVAAKFRVLQHALYMNEISLSAIMGVFERHKLGATESTLTLESYDLEAVLSDIYFAANKLNHTNIDIDFATELMMNFLYNVYDKDRRDNIQVSSVKLVLAILSSCKLSDLYHFIFVLCADHNNCVTRLKLLTALAKFTSLAIYLHEDVNFGHHLSSLALDSCFSNSPGLVGISETSFISWLESGPQILSWIPTLHRMNAAEPAVHNVRCSVCKASPLLGLRYRCVKCSNYIQCQHCFLSAKTSNSHKLSHPMKEYCMEGSSRDFAHMFLKKLCKLMGCSTRLNPTNFAANIVETKILSNNKDCKPSADDTCNSKIEPLSSPEMQLQIIIKQLELQNRELHEMVVVNKSNDQQMKQYLEEHRLHIATQINKLKTLKEYLQTAQPAIVKSSKTIRRMESTPLIANGKRNLPRLALDNILSPIDQITERNTQEFLQHDTWQASNSNVLSDSNSLPSYSVKDISTWIGGCPTTSNTDIFQESDSTSSSDNTKTGKSPVCEMHNDLDEVLAKLQQILANNFILDESLGTTDNGQLKTAVTEVEGMLTSLIDGVENNRANSVHQDNQEHEQETIVY